MNNVKAMVKKNYEMSKMLNEENDKIYTDIVCYLRVSMPETVKTEEIISDILDMFLRSQQQETPIKDMIGEDYKEFCDSIIDSVKTRGFSFQGFKENAALIVDCFFILLTINLLVDYLPHAFKNKAIMDYSFNAAFLINSVIIIVLASGIVTYIGKNSFELSDIKKKKPMYFVLWLGLTIMLFSIMMISVKLSKYQLLSINVYFVLISVAVYWVYKKLIKSA